MGRASANAYKSGSRPYGQPAISTAFRDSTPRPQGVGPSRNNLVVTFTKRSPSS